MNTIRQMCGLAMIPVLALALLGGCKAPEQPLPQKEKPAAQASAAAPAAVPEAVQKAVLEAAALFPADAAVVGTVRSPKDLVDILNESVGPELSAMSAAPLTFLPAGAFDMEGPVAWAVLLTDSQPSIALAMRVKDAARLKGEDAGEGIIRVTSGSFPIHVARVGLWGVFGALDAVKAFKAGAAKPRLALDGPSKTLAAESLAWVRVQGAPLAALAEPEIKQMKTRFSGAQPGKDASAEAKAVEWLDGFVHELEALDVGLVVDEQHLAVRTALTLTEKSQLLAVARAMKPVERFDGALPETDRFLAAVWTRVDPKEATPKFKAFLSPLMDLLMAEFQKQAERKDAAPSKDAAANSAALVRKAISEQWALMDQYADVVGERSAVLFEQPEPGKGLFRMTQAADLKDVSAYTLLLKKSMGSTESLLKAVDAEVAKKGGGPNIAMDYKTAAETIEGQPVDVMSLKFAMDPSSNLPPQGREMAKNVMNAVWGGDTLIMRAAVVEKQAIQTLGDADMMARAIKHARGQGGDLAKMKPIAAALGRVPAGSSVVALISSTAVAAAVDTAADDIMTAFLPPQQREALKSVPMPRIERPMVTEPTLLSVRVEGRIVRLDVDVPRADAAGTVPYLRHAYGRLIVFMIQQIPMMAGSSHPIVVPPPMSPMPPKAPTFEEIKPAPSALDGPGAGE
jgi:hypothetical protein